MLRYLYGDEIGSFPKLRATMFRDRADQFKGRLGWDVTVDQNGYEIDQYDPLNPLYVIWERPDGSHGGSMRFLPTVGRTMVNEHFNDLTDGVKIESPLIWECTRFCLAPEASSVVSSALMLGGVELGLRFHLTHAVGVFDARMVRIYRRLGWAPTVLGEKGDGKDAVSVGLWEFSKPVRHHLLEKTGVSAEASEYWFDRSFGIDEPLAATG